MNIFNKLRSKQNDDENQINDNIYSFVKIGKSSFILKVKGGKKRKAETIIHTVSKINAQQIT